MSDGKLGQVGETLTGLGYSVVRGLTPQYLGLCLINLVFVLSLIWYFDHLRADRIVLFNRLMDVCFANMEKAKP